MPIQRTVAEWDAFFESLMINTRTAVGAQNFVETCRLVEQFHNGLKEFIAGADAECNESVMFKSYAMVVGMLASAACRFAANDISPTSDVLEMVDRAMLKMKLQKHESAIMAMARARAD